MRVKGSIAAVVLFAACSGTAVDVTVDAGDAGPDVPPISETVEFASLPDEVEVQPDIPGVGDAAEFDLPPMGCEPGEGCFLDECADNSDCDSGWCVEHMGDKVCSMTCQEECPPGWTCTQVAGTVPDIVFICVSDFPNLCRPCASMADCAGTAGTEDACVSYGAGGNFCGGACAVEAGAGKECPWGFSCADVLTVDGVELKQCVNEAGVCPCTDTSVALGLWTPCQLSNEWGLCQGKRVCLEEGLSDCDAPVPAAEECNGTDDDCDGDLDEETCADENPCTDDQCAGAAGCEHVALNGAECLDGNLCTVADHCEDGVCLGDPVMCDDNNPCTDDECTGDGGCFFYANDDPCDDGNPCTVADKCKGSECEGVPLPCDCKGDEDCEALEDGDVCNGTLTCDLTGLPFECVVDPATVVACGQPEGKDAICLKAACNPVSGECSFVPEHEGYACEDGNLCSLGDVCAGGVCTPGQAANCNDGSPCTDDTCDPDAGCGHEFNSAPCVDGNPCTLGDYCEEGVCEPGEPQNCNDANPCTDDACDDNGMCVHVPNDAACDDGNACTAGDHCEGGACKSTGPEQCDDGEICTTDLCDPAVGCVHSLNQVPCDDGDPCTVNDHCLNGVCGAGPQLDCDDGNVCTDDSCGESELCVHLANDGLCDDGSACTVGDHCVGGACQTVGELTCDDGNLCTNDVCDPGAGCLFESNTLPCNDGDACTPGDHCAQGACVPGETMDCDDGNTCTDDSCDPGAGCLHEANQGDCDDGNSCTVGESCVDGWCAGAEPLACDDDDLCTSDHCLPAEGCQNVPVIPCCGNGVVEEGEDCDDGGLEDGDGCSSACLSETDTPLDWQGDGPEGWVVSNEKLIESPPSTIDTCRCGGGGDQSANCLDNTTAWPVAGQTTFSSGPPVMGGSYWDGVWGHESHRGDGVSFRRTGLEVQAGKTYVVEFLVTGLAATINGSAGGENYFPNWKAGIVEEGAVLAELAEKWGPGGQVKNPTPMPGDLGVFTFVFTPQTASIDLVFTHRYSSSQCMSEAHDVNMTLDYVTIASQP